MNQRECFYLQLLLAIGLALLGRTLPAATLHVEAKAPSQGTGSAAVPFTSIADAVEAASPGDTIVVGQGTYRIDRTLWLDKARLTLTGISGERPILVGDQRLAGVIAAVADGVVLQELVVQGGFYGVKVDVGEADCTRGVIIRNCQIGSTGADCIKSYNADDLLIENCRLGPSGAIQRDNAEGIDVIGSIGVTIRGCTVEDVSTNGIYLKGGARNGLVERCLIRRARHGGILLGQDTDPDYMRDRVKYEAINCVARNNIIAETGSAGLGTYSGKDVRFINNTLLDVAKQMQAAFWVVTNSRHVPAEGVTFRNNIVVVGGERPAMFVKDATGLPESDHNLYYGRRGSARFVREMSVDSGMYRSWTLAQAQRAVGIDRNSREGDPRLGKSDYRPANGSPAAGAGGAIPELQDDYFGKRRSGWDVGAVACTPADGEG